MSKLRHRQVELPAYGRTANKEWSRTSTLVGVVQESIILTVNFKLDIFWCLGIWLMPQNWKQQEMRTLHIINILVTSKLDLTKEANIVHPYPQYMRRLETWIGNLLRQWIISSQSAVIFPFLCLAATSGQLRRVPEGYHATYSTVGCFLNSKHSLGHLWGY